MGRLPDQYDDRYGSAIDEQSENGYPQVWVALLCFNIARQRWQDPKQDGKHRQRQSGRDECGRWGTPALSHRLERSEQCRGDHHYDDEPQPGINLRAALGVRVIKEPDLKQQGSGDGELNRDYRLEILNRHGRRRAGVRRNTVAPTGWLCATTTPTGLVGSIE